MAEFYDTEMDNPFDANYNFSFLDNYIAKVSRKAANPNNQVIENDQAFYELDDEVEQVESELENEALREEGTKVAEEDFMMEELFADDANSYARQFISQPYKSAGRPVQEAPVGNYVPTSGKVEYKPGVTTQGWKPKAASIVDGISEMVGNITVTSTVRSQAENQAVGGVKNSFHLTGEAVDLRPNKNLDAFLTSPQGRKYLAEQGYKAIDERNKKNGAHWHLQPIRRKYGGNVARTKQQQYIGLNDESMDDLFLPLKGINTIRGLDNGQPVHVMDDNGAEAVLYGPDDTIQMKGGVREKRLFK